MDHKKTPTKMTEKTSELCALCVIETAIVIYSIGGKAFSFCQPCADRIINRFHHGMPAYSGSSQLEIQGDQKSDALLEHLEAERKSVEELEQFIMATHVQRWLSCPVEELSFEELLTMDSFLADFQRRAQKQLEKLSSQTSTSTSANPAGFDAAIKKE